MKILLVRLGGVSEVLLATPLLRCLHRTVPAAELHVLTGHAFAHLLQYNPFVHKLHASATAEATVASLKEEGCDWLIDLQNDEFSNRVARELGCKQVKVKRHSRPLLARLGLQQATKDAVQFVQDCFTAVAPLGVTDDGGGLDYGIAETEQVSVHDVPHSHHAGFLCVAIEPAVGETKLPLQVLQAICGRVNHPLVLIGQKDDILQGDAIASADPIKIYNACGKFSFAESADLIRQSKLLVAGPSSWVQVGAALKKEMIVLQKGSAPLDATPYYGQKFLQQTPGVFDAVHSNKSFWRVGKASFDVPEILEKIQHRLRKPNR